MDLSTTQQILLIILSSVLAIFLILGIAAIIMVLALLKKVRMIADKAEHLVDSASSIGQMLKKAAGPMTVLQTMRRVAGMVKRHRSND